MFIEMDDSFRLIESFYRSFPDYKLDDTGNGYSLNVDLPGVAKENLKVQVSDEEITIEAERDGVVTKKVFYLPDTVDSDNVHADLKDGVLTISLPKTQRAKPRMIEIGPPKNK